MKKYIDATCRNYEVSKERRNKRIRENIDGHYTYESCVITIKANSYCKRAQTSNQNAKYK